MTIKQQGGIFGRNPTFNNVTVDGNAAFQEASFNTTADGVVVDVQKNGTTAGGLGIDGGDLISGTGNTGFRFLDSSVAILPWDFAGNTNNNGAIDLGNSSNRFADIHLAGNVVIGTSGKGIDFSATDGTGTSELFDDYEEGTFTPTVSDAGSGGNNATIYSTRTGYYTKIGRLVTATITVTNINTTPLTAGNDVFITGLPFAVGSQSNYIGSCMASDVTFSGMVVARAMSGETHVKIAENTSGASLDYIVVSELTSGAADIILTVTYEV